MYSVSVNCMHYPMCTGFSENVQRSAADQDLASLISSLWRERERERGGGGGVKGSAHFALQILVIYTLAVKPGVARGLS